MIMKSFFALTNKFSQLFTSGVREYLSNVTSFDTFKGLIMVGYWLDAWERDDPQPMILLSMKVTLTCLTDRSRRNF